MGSAILFSRYSFIGFVSRMSANLVSDLTVNMLQLPRAEMNGSEPRYQQILKKKRL